MQCAISDLSLYWCRVVYRNIRFHGRAPLRALPCVVITRVGISGSELGRSKLSTNCLPSWGANLTVTDMLHGQEYFLRNNYLNDKERSIQGISGSDFTDVEVSIARIGYSNTCSAASPVVTASSPKSSVMAETVRCGFWEDSKA